MSKNHLKRLNAPKSWPILQRKGIKFIAKPLAGPHNLIHSMPISVILKDILGCANTTREVKKILHDKKVLINNSARKDHRFPVGFMDVISIPGSNEYYRFLYNEKGKFFLKKISKEDSLLKFSKIKNKTILKGKKIQLNLYDGTNLLVPKDGYGVGDTLVLEQNKIKKSLKLEKGALIFLIGGKYLGKTGILENIYKTSPLTETKISLKMKDAKVETLKKYAFVIEKDLL